MGLQIVENLSSHSRILESTGKARRVAKLDGTTQSPHCGNMRVVSGQCIAHVTARGILGLVAIAGIGCQPRFETHSRTVTATAYTLRAAEGGSHGQIGLGAWGDPLADRKNSIAVSRDLLKAGLHHGSKVWIDGLDGTWVVRDKMNRRWSNRIDILMNGELDRAGDWGRRKVTIHWYTPAAQD